MAQNAKGTLRGWTSQDHVFTWEYLRTLNQTLAARAAGSSEASAATQGCHYMKKPHIKQYIKDVFAKQAQNAVLDARRVLKEIERLALVDPVGAFNTSGGLLDIHLMGEDVRRCISSIDVEELWQGKGDDREQIGVVKKIRFWSKTDGLQMLAKYLRMWVDAGQGSASGAPAVDLSRLTDTDLKALAKVPK